MGIADVCAMGESSDSENESSESGSACGCSSEEEPPDLVDSSGDERDESSGDNSSGDESSSQTTSDPEASPRFVSKGGTPTPCESKGAGTDSGEDSSSSSAAPDVIAKCAKEVMCPGLVKETWAEHVRVHGPHHKGPRCRFTRCRDKYEAALTYDLGNGESGTWLEQVCTAEHAWGLGCKLCRWAGKDNAFARGEIRGERATQLARLRRHAHADRCHAHREALEELQKRDEFTTDVNSSV